MSQQTESSLGDVSDSLRAAATVFAGQARALDEVFASSLKKAAEGLYRSNESMRTALKAQAQCRSTLKILLALEAEIAAEKKSKFRQTNYRRR
jgi:hypothetical protein